MTGADADAARDRISGILIGAEIAAGLAQGTGEAPVRILASGRLADLYIEAFDLLGIGFAVEDADRAVLAGLTLAAGRIWP